MNKVIRKIIPLGLIFALTFIGAQAVSDVEKKTLEFLELKERHFDGWMDFHKKMMNEKADLMKESIDSMLELHKKQFQDWIDFAASGADAAAREELLKQHLQQKIDLYKDHMEKWNDLHKMMKKEGMQMYKEHKAALEELGNF